MCCVSLSRMDLVYGLVLQSWMGGGKNSMTPERKALALVQWLTVVVCLLAFMFLIKECAK